MADSDYYEDAWDTNGTAYPHAKKFLEDHPQVHVIPLVGKQPAPGVQWARPRQIDEYDWEGIDAYGVIPIGLTVIDIDSVEAGQGFEAAYGEYCGDTMVVSSPNGAHVYFSGESEHRNGLLTNIDVRSGPKGYVVGPGSVVGGKAYSLFIDNPIQPLPDAYFQAINQPRAPLELAMEGGSFQQVANATGYNNALISLKGKLIKVGIDEEIANQMVRAANACLENPYPDHKLEQTVLSRKEYAVGTFEMDQIRPAGGRLTTEEHRRRRPPLTWLVQDIIPEHGIGQLWAASGRGKSFAAIDLSMRICNHADEWMGVPLTIDGPGDVVYVLSEGSLGFQRRVDAWSAHYRSEWNRDVDGARLYDLNGEEFFVDLASQEGVSLLQSDILDAGIQPRLIVIDTQGQLLASMDENSNSEFNLAVSRLKRLSKALGCAILLVHHTGHEDTRARGAAAMKQAMDFELGITREGEIRLLKVKEAEPALEGAFRLSPSLDSVYFDFYGNEAVTANEQRAAEETARQWNMRHLAEAREYQTFVDGGMSSFEIAAEFDVANSTVRRRLQLLRDFEESQQQGEMT